MIKYQININVQMIINVLEEEFVLNGDGAKENNDSMTKKLFFKI